MRKKSLLVLVAILAAICAVFALSGCGAESNAKLEERLEGFEYVCEDGVYTITGVKDYTIRKIEVPEGVQAIADGAFANCVAVTDISLPNSLKYVGYGLINNGSFFYINYNKYENACYLGNKKNPYLVLVYGFTYNAATEETLMANKINDKCKFIYYGAFSYNNPSEEMEIPNSVISIGAGAFEGCYELKSIKLSDNLTSIEDSAFRNCSSLTSIKIPESVTKIGREAFSGCSSLTSVNIPEKVEEIGDNAFSNCKSLKEITVSDKNNHYTNKDGILYNKELTEIIAVPSAIEGDIVIPEGVTSIKEGIFYGCSLITGITIPSSVTDISWGTFNGCKIERATIPVNLCGYINKDNLKTVVITGNGEIEGSAFYDCSSLTSVTIGNGVTSIGQYAFSGCSSLTSIVIPDSVTSIEYYAFSSCTSLTSIIIPDSVTSIGWDAFSGCSSLASITIPDSVTSIDQYAFLGCSSLTSVTIGNGVTNIGSSVFKGCDSLTGVYITDIAAWCSITFGYQSNPLSYAEKLYLNNELVTDLVIPDSVTSVGNNAFVYCNSLTSVTIGKGVTSIGDSAFEYCSSLTSVTIGSGVTSIGDDAINSERDFRKTQQKISNNIENSLQMIA